MRRYETITIVDPDLSDAERGQRFDKIVDLINQMNGVIIETEDWGNKRLAYEIRKKTRGHYLRFDYCGTGELVAEFERNCRIDDKFLKYMTIILQDSADPEVIKQEIADSRAKKAAEEEAAMAQNADTDDESDKESDDKESDDTETDDATEKEDD